MTSLADIAGALTELRPAGPGRLRGLCPLHQERTPSFFVFEDRQKWRCFGCGEHGDVYDFLRLTRGLSYPQARAFLGIDSPKATAEALRELARKRRERFKAEWAERDLAWTLGNAIRRSREALERMTPDTLDDFALVLQSLPVLEYQHQILIEGTPEDKAAVVAEWAGVRLFDRQLLFRREFDFAGWVRRISGAPNGNLRGRGAGGDSGRVRAAA